jgi:acetylornithine deacetylase
VAPFYDVKDVKKAIEGYVAEINATPSSIETPQAHGPHSKYNLVDEGKAAKLELTWLTNGENGIACNLESKGYRALMTATKKILGDAQPYSIGGSLPLIRDLQDSGFDVMISGYGMSSKYHADNEAASLSHFKEATQIIANVTALTTLHIIHLHLLYLLLHSSDCQ